MEKHRHVWEIGIGNSIRLVALQSIYDEKEQKLCGPILEIYVYRSA